MDRRPCRLARASRATWTVDHVASPGCAGRHGLVPDRARQTSRDDIATHRREWGHALAGGCPPWWWSLRSTRTAPLDRSPPSSAWCPIRKQVTFMGDTFKAGDKIKKSGIYSVLHEGEHSNAHDVTC